MNNISAWDSFKNFVANLNTSRDKQSGGAYYLTTLNDNQLSNIYRESWMGRKVIDIPAKDATRKWREWEAEQDQIKLIEAEEKRLHLPQKVKKALQQSRLYGGAAIYFSIEGDDPSLPLDLKSIKQGSLSFVTVFPRSVLIAGDLETDPMAENYDMPKSYKVSGTTGGPQEIHPSRLAVFTGNELLNTQETPGTYQGWGDSVLQSAYDAVRNADSTATNTASLVYEAKVDVLQIPGLGDIMADQRTRGLLVDRIELAAQLKGNNGMLIIDGDESHEQKSFTFTGLPEIGYQALQAVSGAADIPLTRFLGQSPAGMNSTGESDLKNYYDSVNSMQTLTMTPALHNLDEVLIRSTLGNRPDEIKYEWASLWQMSDEQKSKISKETAETIESLARTGLFNENDLSEASANLLVEHSILPSFEATASQGIEDGMAFDATPRTLYVYRRVINTKDIMRWARQQGIEQMVPDLHVTVAYSREPVDWLEMGEDWASDERGQLRLKPGGARSVELFGEANVLVFSSNSLKWRHEDMQQNGASWDYDDYNPHITLTYGELPDDVEPYQGPIVLGPEVFEELNEGWKDKIEEVKL